MVSENAVLRQIVRKDWNLYEIYQQDLYKVIVCALRK